jgi:hypothetical protein
MTGSLRNHAESETTWAANLYMSSFLVPLKFALTTKGYDGRSDFPASLE